MSFAVEPWFVPDTTPLKDQLNQFLKRKAQMALVVDEYGEVQGLITLEDILEEIVGQIADEHDTQEAAIRPQADGTVNVDGTVAIRDLNRQMNWNLPDEEATTIAGLVIHEAQTIPEPGQVFTFYGYRFEILRKTRNKITALRISPAAGSRRARRAAGSAGPSDSLALSHNCRSALGSGAAREPVRGSGQEDPRDRALLTPRRCSVRWRTAQGAQKGRN